MSAAVDRRLHGWTYHSALATEIGHLKEGQRDILGIQDSVVFFWNTLVACADVLTADDDPRPWADRLDSFFQQVGADDVADAHLQNIVAYANLSPDAITDWARKLKRPGLRLYFNRLLGAAVYHRLEQALRKDAEVIVEALRRAAKNLMPYAVALEDLFSVLPPAQRNTKELLGEGTFALLAMLLQVDLALGSVLDAIPQNRSMIVSVDSSSLDLEELTALANNLRGLVSGKSRAAVARLNAALSRKIQGAHDALTHSADSVAQSANSQIELIDRLLRGAFIEEEVIAWVGRNYRALRNTSYVDRTNGKVRPTKMAQALCFVHAGADVDNPSPLHQMAAAALTTMRGALQKLKHSDLGTPEEAHEVSRYLAALEGFLSLAVDLAWAAAPTERVDELRQRLGG